VTVIAEESRRPDRITLVAFLAFVTMAGGNVVPELARTWLAQVYLVILGSVALFPLYVFVIRRWTATAVEGVLIPLVAILLAAWLPDERLTWSFLAGSGLVLVGVYVGALRRPSMAVGR
jgi:drug/metabolite transporter (DMT)-like permease